MGYRPRGSMSGLAKASDLVNAAEGARIAFMDSVGTHQKRLESSRLMARQQVQDDRQKVADSRSTILFDQNQEGRDKKLRNEEFARNYTYNLGNTKDIHSGAMKTFENKFGADLKNVAEEAKKEADKLNLPNNSSERSNFIAGKIKELNPDIKQGARSLNARLKSDVFSTVRSEVLKATGDRNLANDIATDESSRFFSRKELIDTEASRVEELRKIQKDKIAYNKDVVDTFERYDLKGQGFKAGVLKGKTRKSFAARNDIEFWKEVDANVKGWDNPFRDKAAEIRNLLRDKKGFTNKDNEFIKQAIINTHSNDKYNINNISKVANDAIRIKKEWEAGKDERLRKTKNAGITNVVNIRDYQTARRNLQALNRPIISRSIDEIMGGRTGYKRQTRDDRTQQTNRTDTQAPPTRSFINRVTDNRNSTETAISIGGTTTPTDRNVPRANVNRSIPVNTPLGSNMLKGSLIDLEKEHNRPIKTTTKKKELLSPLLDLNKEHIERLEAEEDKKQLEENLKSDVYVRTKLLPRMKNEENLSKFTDKEIQAAGEALKNMWVSKSDPYYRLDMEVNARLKAENLRQLAKKTKETGRSIWRGGKRVVGKANKTYLDIYDPMVHGKRVSEYLPGEHMRAISRLESEGVTMDDRRMRALAKAMEEGSHNK